MELDIRPPQHNPEAAAAPDQAPSDAASVLGDIDLVQAIMDGGHDVVDVALRLIAQQTHWSDLSLQPMSDGQERKVEAEATNHEIGVAVTHGNRCFGMLCTPSATAEQLQPWADWLGHWLAMDCAFHEHRCRSLQDDLTGAGNRRFFQSFLQGAIERAAKARRPVTVMVFDIDNFKSYNDQFGHEAGDEILRETVRLMQAVIRQGDRVCRIGGDEFAVIFADDEAPREPGSTHPESVEVIATRFQDQICQMRFPKLGPEAPGTLSISAGLATYPWDGNDPAALLRHADQLALESKRKGKNIITFGKGARAACGDAQ